MQRHTSCQYDAIEHMANYATGLIRPPLSSHSSMLNSSSSQIPGKHVRYPSDIRSALLATSSVRSSPRRSRNGESSLVVRRLAKPRKRRQGRQRLRRQTRNAKRQRRQPALTRVLKLLRRDETGLHQRLPKRKCRGVWSRSVCRLRSISVWSCGLEGSGVGDRSKLSKAW